MSNFSAFGKDKSNEIPFFLRQCQLEKSKTSGYFF